MHECVVINIAFKTSCTLKNIIKIAKLQPVLDIRAIPSKANMPDNPVLTCSDGVAGEGDGSGRRSGYEPGPGGGSVGKS